MAIRQGIGNSLVFSCAYVGDTSELHLLTAQAGYSPKDCVLLAVLPSISH